MSIAAASGDVSTPLLLTLQYRHYEALRDIFRLKPSKESKEFGDLVMFVAQVRAREQVMFVPQVRVRISWRTGHVHGVSA